MLLKYFLGLKILILLPSDFSLVFLSIGVFFVFQYNKPSETLIPESVDGLQENLDVVVSLAERHYYNCDFKMCYKLTSV